MCLLSTYYSLTDQHAGTPMGITAENLAEKYGITRQVRALCCDRSNIVEFKQFCAEFIDETAFFIQKGLRRVGDS